MNINSPLQLKNVIFTTWCKMRCILGDKRKKNSLKSQLQHRKFCVIYFKSGILRFLVLSVIGLLPEI